ncbi:MULTISPECIES: glycoside hydrolase family 2 protein [unclassified Paenibacillus]|uniref:glycoside hydrolase family 2 protein n=1 Tax=unclassified Paenibacillus TaxID=185978 RepID=UPI00362FCC6E
MSQIKDAPNNNTSRTIHGNWSFAYFPSADLVENPSEPSYDETEWIPIAIPHTWITYETTGELHPFIRQPSEKDDKYWWYGWGWYRKSIHLSSEHKNKKIFIEFDGVMKYCRIYMNGRQVGEHKGGYASFSVDVSSYIRFDEMNVLAVAVSNRRNDPFGIPPMTAGNFNVYGGIYRDVRLVLKDKLHIPFQGSAEHEGGTFITTPEVTAQWAMVRVRTFVKNDSEALKKTVLKTIIMDEDHCEVAVMVSEADIHSGQLFEFDQGSPHISYPKLWSPDEPNLYKVVSMVFEGERLTDLYKSPLGFRWFEWDYERKQLIWNGKELHIHGTNRHQEYPWLGDAIPKWMHEKDLRDIKYNLGHNFIRTCHYSQDKYVYDFCDKHGMIVCEEVPNIKNIRFDNAVQEQQVREMIKRDRNHPSIVIWSMGNETNHAADGAWAREEDCTRIIHYRHVAGRGENEPHNHHQLEMENLLRCTVRGWYNEDVKPLTPENGQHTGHERWQHDMALMDGASQRGRIDMNGVMWIYADHGADREYVNAPLKHINPKGWVDAYREPKLMYYLWQAYWGMEPMVYIHPYYWMDRYIGQKRQIVINSNCDELELYINGNTVGKQKPGPNNDFTVIYEGVPIEQGTIQAIGSRGEHTVTSIVTMSGPPAKIVAEPYFREIAADRSGLALIRVDIVDGNGIHVFGATNELLFTVDGPGKLVGPDRYVSNIHSREEMEGTMYIDTPVSFLVRSTGKPGMIHITVSSPGLEPAKLSLESKQNPSYESHGIIEPISLARGDGAAWRHRSNQFMETAKIADILPFIIEDIDFDETESPYDEQIENYLSTLNPVIKRDSPAFLALKGLMVSQLVKGQGIIVADDFNFNISRYNDCCSVYDVLDCSMLSETIVITQKWHYAEKIITQGEELDMQHEIQNMNRLELFGK